MVFLLTVERRQVAHSVDAWQEEVRPALEGGERRQTLEYLADRPVGDLVLQRAVLRPAGRVPLLAEFVERPVVDPDVLSELELAHQAGADDERCDAAVHPVIGCPLRHGGAVGGATADHSAPVHVVRGITRIEAPRMDPSGHAYPCGSISL